MQMTCTKNPMNSAGSKIASASRLAVRNTSGSIYCFPGFWFHAERASYIEHQLLHTVAEYVIMPIVTRSRRNMSRPKRPASKPIVCTGTIADFSYIAHAWLFDPEMSVKGFLRMELSTYSRQLDILKWRLFLIRGPAGSVSGGDL
jgi:hypothetical protein